MVRQNTLFVVLASIANILILSVILLFRKVIRFIKKIFNCIMANNYPMPAYHFIVDWGGANIGFYEVSGLNLEVDVTEFRDGSSPEQHTRKMPGLIKYNNVILKRGVRHGDNDFFNWINTIRLNTVERRDITISLLNEDHNPVMSWRLRNTFPVKYSGPVLTANSSDIAMEELEIAHEGFVVSTV
jgi:phage tail-like protein